jgi:hypothetical protein
MREELAQHIVEVTGSGNEKVVEAFPAQGPDEAFRDRVRPRRPDRRADDPDVSADEDASNAAVNLLSRSRIKNRNRST